MRNADEWWDILDGEGLPTGEVFRRGDNDFPLDRFHLVVTVCVQRADGAVLLTQRAPSREFGRRWEFPGGSALAGETSTKAASRELHEETGIYVSPEGLRLIGQHTEGAAIVNFYTSRVGATPSLALQVAEVMAAEWVSPDEVLRRLELGMMADPWAARLRTLWPLAVTVLNRSR